MVRRYRIGFCAASVFSERLVTVEDCDSGKSSGTSPDSAVGSTDADPRSSSDSGVVEQISTEAELGALLHSAEASGSRVLPYGGGTKLQIEPTTSAGGGPVIYCDMTQLCGVTAYDASEYLISARAGTRLSELVAVLAEAGQYFPFDPCFVESGSTIGGAIAAGISGPCRGLYGTLRDFVMEVVFADGSGQLVRGGGRVVKNAAGFDFPKAFVGSLGRLGILNEVTLKVFPRPVEWATFTAKSSSMTNAIAACQRLQSQPLPITGLHCTSGTAPELRVRFAGPHGSLQAVVSRAADLLKGLIGKEHAVEVQPVGATAENSFWASQTQMLRHGWIRTVQNPSQAVEMEDFCRRLNCEREYWAGGEVAWLRCEGEHIEALHGWLESRRIAGMLFPLGKGVGYRIGSSHWVSMASRIQHALDVKNLFVPY